MFMSYPTQSTIIVAVEAEEDPYSSISIAHALDSINQSQCHVESQPVKSCLKSVNTEKKLQNAP